MKRKPLYFIALVCACLLFVFFVYGCAINGSVHVGVAGGGRSQSGNSNDMEAASAVDVKDLIGDVMGAVGPQETPGVAGVGAAGAGVPGVGVQPGGAPGNGGGQPPDVTEPGETNAPPISANPYAPDPLERHAPSDEQVQVRFKTKYASAEGNRPEHGTAVFLLPSNRWTPIAAHALDSGGDRHDCTATRREGSGGSWGPNGNRPHLRMSGTLPPGRLRYVVTYPAFADPASEVFTVPDAHSAIHNTDYPDGGHLNR